VRCSRTLRSGLAELRNLAHGLHPAGLSDRGLGQALTALTYRAAVPVDLRVGLPPERLPISVESAAYFTVCEALTDVAAAGTVLRARLPIA
jgi:signal transduction histidine kinase